MDTLLVDRNRRMEDSDMILTVCSDDKGFLDEDYYYDAEQTVYDVGSSYHADCHQLPVASATLLDPFIIPMESAFTADHTADTFLAYSRPEFIFVSAIIEEGNPKLGLFMKNRPNGGTYVSRLADFSPLQASNIRLGDHIVAVNNILCSHLSNRQVAKLIMSTKGTIISFCFHNEQGDPSLISCSVQKPHPTSRVGVTLRKQRDAVRVIRVSKDGLFGNSLLMPYHRCMMINGISCKGMTSKIAGDFIATAKERVTIISKPQENCALTIALYQQTQWWTKIAIGAGLAVGAVSAMGASWT